MLKLKKMLGKGSFSVVWEGINLDGRKVAIKVEKKDIKKPILEREFKIHSHLYKKDIDKKYIVPVYEFYSDENRNYMIMEKMYITLGKVLKKIDIKFDDYSLRNIAIKLIETLQFIHKNGFCHCDIKPDNIVMTEDYQNVYLIDYGLAKNYKRKNIHIDYNDNINPFGTLKYMSVHTNNRKGISRRDDLISLGYVLIYLQKTYLPWQDESKKNNIELVAKMKLEVDVDKLCDECVDEIKDYIRYCYDLKYNDEPDYEMLKSLFKKNLLL